MRNIIRNGLVMLMCIHIPNLTHAAQFITLEIDPLKSWVQDQSWVEVLPNSEGEIPDLYSGRPFGQPWPEAIYHEEERHFLSGSVNVILARKYLNSLEIEETNVLPGKLSSGREVILDLNPQTLKNGVFPNNSFNLPPGAICACISEPPNLNDPIISGVFDGTLLTVDFVSNDRLFTIRPNYISWIGSAPPNVIKFDSGYRYHLEAKVVPLPPAFVLFLSALGSMSLVKVYAARK